MGNYYDGQVNNLDQKDGCGIELTRQGGMYEGLWKGGMKHGKGHQITPIGDIYIG